MAPRAPTAEEAAVLDALRAELDRPFDEKADEALLRRLWDASGETSVVSSAVSPAAERIAASDEHSWPGGRATPLPPSTVAA